ncbi:MAG: bifunctional 4-hydroxy-2-oxoglutarate aldolase/2-dehydro-3-deoxy-phosphogluconate aldolase, partial [Deltaproteobacteria bacterium]|nr:bifunctional 4-hydroxy-2-oxoglutarate aldolase/2-dehydro-3-deoxy-phosphogluconate aldolase [Deltaproteobacteria bacterium]
LRAGGIDVIELTMTVPFAVELIRELARSNAKSGGFVLGAGTVLDAETARACILAGAQFVVSPATDEATISCCRTYGTPVLAGALTPTEIIRAWRAGSDLVKVFPCGAVGGASYIKAVKAPLPQIELVPTGGVSLETAADFITAGASAVGAGADLVDLKKLRAGDTAAITDRARRYLEEVARARRSNA